MYIFIAITIILAYLIGSIPNAVWIGKVFYGIDVRKEGSKNAGATNTFRVLGWKPGLVVLVLDFLKGALPLALQFFLICPFYPHLCSVDYMHILIWMRIAMAIAIVLGHVFPIYVGFRGGKGVATLVGVLLLLYPIEFFMVATVFFTVFFLFRYVSLASMCAAVSLPVISFVHTLWVCWGWDSTDSFYILNSPLFIFAILIAVFVPLTHIKNIKRLIRGEEPKFVFKKHS